MTINSAPLCFYWFGGSELLQTKDQAKFTGHTTNW